MVLTLAGGAVDGRTDRSRTSLPPRPTGLVARPTVSARLAAPGRSVVVVVGPAGAGKSAAVAAWASQARTSVAWLTLRPGDEARLGELLQLALVQAGVVGGPSPEGEELPATLVLDDLHVLDPVVAADHLEELLVHRPTGLRLVLVSRRPPPIALHRLRLGGGLEEIGPADLRLGRDELVDLTRSSGVDLGRLDGALLLDRTGGWPGAARLATLALAAGELDVEQAAAGAVAAMLDAEVADPALEAYLEAAAVLGPAPDELLDAVLGIGGTAAAARVDTVSPGLLDRADPGRVALTPMVAEAVRAKAVHDDPASVDGLLLAAAHWHEEQGDEEAALELLLAAHAARGVRALADRALGLHFEGRTADLRRMLEQVDPVAVPGAPGPALVLAGAFAIVGRADDGARIVAGMAEEAQGRPELVLGVDLVLARCHQVWGEPERGLLHLERALVQLGGAADGPRAVQDPLVADARLHLELMDLHLDRGDGRAARDAYLAAPAMAPSYGRLDAVLVPGALARAELLDGSLDAARDAATRSIEAARRLGLPEGEHLVAARRVLGDVALERDEPDAEEQLQLAVAHARVSAQVLAICETSCSLARAQHAAGLVDDARATLEAARRPVHARALPTAARAAIDVTDARLRLVAGDAAGAEELVAGLPDEHPCRPLLEAWHALLVGAPHRTRALLDALPRPLAGTLELDRALLLARAAAMVDTADDAVEHVRRAVAIGWSDRRVRTFAEHGPAIEALLRRVRDGGRSSAYVRAILDAMPTGPAPDVRSTLATDLTSREREVLRRLASSLSNQEIAGMLDISLNTLKSHVKSIYRKLHVENRDEAVELTRRFRLDDEPGTS